MVFILYFSTPYSGIELYYETRCIQLMTIGSGDVYLQTDDGRQSDEERNERGGNRLFIYLLGGK
jgi:hypothetical protein